MYLGSKFIKDTIKLPNYFHSRNSLTLEKVKSRLPAETLHFITYDMEEFISSIMNIPKKDRDKAMEKVMSSKFTKIGTTFVFSSPHHISLSDLKLGSLLSWGFALEKHDPIVVQECREHGSHTFLAPYYLTNPELLTYYQEIMASNDDIEKHNVESNYRKLRELKDNPSMPHEFTIFHCTGPPFSDIAYKEDDWTVRLFYSISQHLPTNTLPRLTRIYQNDFGALQEVFSGQTAPIYYMFRGIPDVVFTTKKTASTDGTTASIDGTSSASTLFVVDDIYEYDFIELKHGGCLPVPRDRPTSLPGAAAQVIGALHALAVAKLLRKIIGQNVIPTEIKCKGLLVKRKDQMILFTATVNISSMCSASFFIRHQDLHLNSLNCTLSHVCSAVKTLVL